jgi:hypothetical protein
VLRFLSDAWIQALDDRASDLEVVEPLGLSVEHVIDDVVYHVAFQDGGVRFVRGPAPSATVRLVTTRAHAAAIARGETSAQRVFMNGELSVEGDSHALVRALPVLREIDDVFADVRAMTDWSELPDA